MQIWFWAAVGSMLLSGLANFIFKVAAKRNYSSELFTLYGGLFSLLIIFPFALAFKEPINVYAVTISFAAGVVAASGGVAKVYALRHIDTTIFFPLFKLLSPALAIVFGMVFFNETFSLHEWFGLLAGLLVPLILITPSENSRQNNLIGGLVLVLFAAIISAIAAALNKYSADLWSNVWWLLAFAALGILVGSVLIICFRKGVGNFIEVIKNDGSKEAMVLTAVRSVIISASLGLALYAYTLEGSLAVVHTIQSLYILIPIVLAIIFYNEHWNFQKATAIVLSIAALAFLH